jgi:hypothetical protein
MQQSTYMSLTTQSIKLKLNSITVKDKLIKFLDNCEEIANNLKIQESLVKQLASHENKISRDFASLVTTADRNLCDINKKNDNLAKKLSKAELATHKLAELKTQLAGKYSAAIKKNLTDKNNNLYDFAELKSSLNIMEDNYTDIKKNINIVKEKIASNNIYYDSLQILLNSLNINKLEKNILHDISATTKNIEYLSSIYTHTTDNKQEIDKFLPQLELNIHNLNQKAEILFMFNKAIPTKPLSEITKGAANDEPNNRDLGNPNLKFG